MTQFKNLLFKNFLAISCLFLSSLFIADNSHAANVSVMADIELSKVNLWWQYKRDVQIGVGMDIEEEDNNEISPALRWYVKRIDDLKLFVSIEAEGLFNSNNDNNDGELDLQFGLGGEYFLQRNFSIVIYVAGGNTINLQYYF